jgi:ubiquinone/menaquinone biosynthesis C-methylase UbiE
MGERDWAKTFSATFSTPASRVQARIWAEVLGSQYPAELDTYSFVTRTELERLRAGLKVPSQGTLLDLGCGRGGPGLWLAARCGCRLVGVDVADSAVAASRDNASKLGLGNTAEFRRGTFEATGLPTGSIDAVLSIDSLLFTPDKPSAIQEMARILRPAGRLGVTTWDYHRQPVGRPPQVSDHRPLLHEAGFRVSTYEDTEDWLGRQTRIIQLLLPAVDEIAAESGDSPAEIRAAFEEMQASVECMSRRVMILAELVG